MNKIIFRFVSVVVYCLGCLASSEGSTTAKGLTSCSDNPLTIEAMAKIGTLEDLIRTAKNKEIDATREETVVWFAKEFLKFADWDENNQDAIAYLFGEFALYRAQKQKMAAEIPDFQRRKVILILDNGIAELSRVLKGEIQRRPVNRVDWQNIQIGDNMLLSQGKPIFLYDYFSKTVGCPLTDTRVYNDHLGAIYHGGENLYPPEHDRAINSYLLKEDRTFDQELLRELTEIPDSNVGFLVYWNQGLPAWIDKQEPESRKGRSTFTGFDIDNPLVREVWGTIARETGAMTRGKKVTQLGYILANEPHWFSTPSKWTKRTGEMQQISSYTLNAFRSWLKEKYGGDLQRLNKNWNSQFASFDAIDIEIPISATTRGTPMFYDWARYSMDRSTSWYAHIQGELFAGNPDADTHIKTVPRLYTENQRATGVDIEALTELTTMIGDDAKVRNSRLAFASKPEPWESHYSMFWEELSMSYDFMESVAPHKIHINSESHFLSAARWRELDLSVDYVECVHWLATLQGMDAGFAWFWARDPDGSPEDRLEGELDFADLALAGSFAGSVNQQPHIANAYTQVMYDLNSVSNEIIELRNLRRPLRLFHSETSAINKKRHMTEQFALYEQLFFDGIPLGFATQNIINKQNNRDWDAILIYKTPFVTESELDALQVYLDQGGTIIMDSSQNLTKDEYGLDHSRHLVANQGQLVVLDGTKSLSQIRDVALKTVSGSRPRIELAEDNGSGHKGCRWVAAKRGDGSYLVSILNLGKHTANINLTMQDADSILITNVMTGQRVNARSSLKSNGVLLLDVKRK